MVTARVLTALKPSTARYVVRDSVVAGLELQVQPTGQKYWSLRYRVNGQRRRLKLGAYPRVSLAEARKTANHELRKADGGVDPQAERQAAIDKAAQAKADSIEALCAAYIERHAKPTKRTWRDDQSKLKREVLRRWRRRPVSSITRRDCRALVQAIADRGAPIGANRMCALLSRLFRFAMDDELIDVNPAAYLPKPGVEAQARPEGEREAKPYSDEEIRRLWQITATLPPAPRAIYRLGLVTGQRPGEISNLEWPELDGSWWTIPARRSKNKRTHRVFLSTVALATLAEVPRVLDQPLAFAGYRSKVQLARLNHQVFAGLRRRVKPRHALRDTVATNLAACGVSAEDISKVLNHTYGPRVTAGYNDYRYDKEKRLALSRWARRLSAIIEGSPSARVAAIGG